MVKKALQLSGVAAFITLLSLGAQLLTARTFGARHGFDEYLFAISLPFLITGAATGALSQAFVPRLLLLRPDPRSYQDAVATLLFIALLAGAALGSGGIWITRASLSAIGTTAHGFTANQCVAVIAIARLAWWSAALALLGSALTAIHHAEKSFLLPSVSATYLYAGTIAAMLCTRAPRRPVVLAWGMLAGSLCAVLMMLPRVLRCLSFACWPRPQLNEICTDGGRVALVILANCAFSGLAPVEAVLAPRFGAGALSHIGYAQRLIIAMGTFVVAGPSVLLVPAVAQAWIAEDKSQVQTLAWQTIGAVTAIATGAALVFGLFRVRLITLVLQRGAFDVATTQGVAGTLPWMLAGSIPMLGTQIAFRVLYGQNRHVAPAIVGLLVPVLYLAMGLLLSRAFGFQGICMAYAACWWVAFLILLGKIFALPADALAGSAHA